MRDKSFLKLIVLALTLLLPLALTNRVNAQSLTQETIDSLCQFGQEGYDETGTTFGPNLSRTGADGAVIDNGEVTTWVSSGMSADQSAKCSVYVLNENGAIASAGLTLTPECQAAIDPSNDYIAQCDSLQSGAIATGTPMKKPSLYGLAFLFEGAINEPMPMNMAYYLNRTGEKLPYVGGTVFAQTVSQFDGPLLDIVYDIWTIARDFALAAMAIVMIIMGIMIMTRKKVDSQTMVTVQYAVPRVVISLTLIFLSYTIGASLASFGWNFSYTAQEIVEEMFIETEENIMGAGHPLESVRNFFITVASVGIFAVQAVATGGVSVIIWGLLNITLGVVQLAAGLYAFMVYVHILLKLIFSPFDFAIGAVPGNNRIEMWFKEVAGKILGLTMLRVMIASANNIARIIVLSGIYGDSGGSSLIPDSLGDAAMTGGLLTVRPFLVPALSIYLLVYAIKSVKKVEGFVTGKSAKSKS